MYLTITCHPGRRGGLHNYTIKQATSQGVRRADILARTGKQAVDIFRAITESKPSEKVAA